ncbi:hypothetical protein [Nostoc sp. TCL240-02]|uniref:hypothetical protein n=1 Tax=Nostoc sp. TCL240-02 TaxID=2572090 RepID=UPI00157F9450|nr:hypothetical protein [Nostoc sp. TCL240-02]
MLNKEVLLTLIRKAFQNLSPPLRAEILKIRTLEDALKKNLGVRVGYADSDS